MDQPLQKKQSPQHADQQSDAQQPALPAKDHTIKGAWQQLKDSTDHFFGTLRYNTVRFLPAFIVNNSSNILGAAHVYTEGIMFKASLREGKLVDGLKPWDPRYYVKAAQRIYTDAFKSALKTGGGHVDIFKGNPLTNVYKFITDTDAATAREIAMQGVAAEHVHLGNPWQTRSTLAGLIGWTISAVLPEKKESDEELERMEIMRKTNLPAYVGTRLGQGLWVPGWISHKRQAIGIGQIVSGVFSSLGAWRNRTRPTAAEMAGGKLPRYIFNAAYLGTGICNLMAGLALTFAADEQSGYGQYGGWVMGMTAFLPFSLAEKFRRNEPGVGWYTAGKASFQVEAWGQALFGGAEKKPDGTIVDHTELKKRADNKAAVIRAEKHAAKQARAHPEIGLTVSTKLRPTSQVSAARSVERVADAPQQQTMQEAHA